MICDITGYMRENDKDNLISMNDSEDFTLGMHTMQAVCWYLETPAAGALD